MPQVTFEVLRKPIEERLIDAACIYWEVERNYFFTKVPDRAIAYRKGIVYYLIKQETNYTLEFIAKKFGFVAHGPVARLIEIIETEIKMQPRQTCNDINQITHLASKLDASYITTSIQLVNNSLELKEV